QVVDREDRFDCPLDVLHRATAGGQEHGLPECGDMALERRVAQIARGELECRDVQLGEQVGALEVERRREQRHPALTCVPHQLPVLVGAELERLTMLAVRVPEAQLVVVRLLVELAGIERPVRALLQLDGVDAALFRGVDEALRLLDVALVVVADFGDDVARLVVAELDAVDDESSHRRSMLVAAPVRSRSRSLSTRSCTSCVKSSLGSQASCVRAFAGLPTSRCSSAAPRASAGSTCTQPPRSRPTWATAVSTSSRTECGSPEATM